MDKALQYIGIARKAGFLAVGEESCGVTVKAGKAKLLLLASDASDNARHRAETFLFGHRAPLRVLPWTKEELSRLMGKHGCSMLCFSELGLASRFAAVMAEMLPEWEETASVLDARREKAQRRKAAPRKHDSVMEKGGNKDGN